MERDNAQAAWLVRAGVFAVTLSSVVAAYRAAGDVASLAFVVVSYAALLLLLACLRAYDHAQPGGRRGRIRRMVWSLSTLPTVLFAWRVAGVMPNWPAVLLVWAMAAATSLGGFVALFHRRP
ncbi:hypothetical protein PR202_ga18164 [Eleusine coracana subsp. coracana]|uniref:Uncharacterized protein n=1 Tax=Eleusine coracana subsp. coracana TaxID=191504 RepID=A0AAV5CSN1_ELECO|nr:hypothetical protein QOZ80_6AG0508580 [Eleusine coracana subsp. coracana]GJN00937.1 hypothetical protein PR202_ga18164 [Eleusine coracana subsp. coracana]